MTAATTNPPETGSAYPPDLTGLVEPARALRRTLGEVPSRNRLMREYSIGAAKAAALRDLLAAEPTPEPAGPAGPDEPAERIRVDPTEPAKIQATAVGHPDPDSTPTAPRQAARRPLAWPVLLLALPAFVAIWSGWVELGRLTGFGVVHPLPGIAPAITLDTAITLPIGVETYAAYALWVWLSGRAPGPARRFARWSAIGSLIFGAAGQVAYHLMAAAGITAAPWQITTAVSCLPVAVLGMGAALAHLIRAEPGAPATPEE